MGGPKTLSRFFLIGKWVVAPTGRAQTHSRCTAANTGKPRVFICNFCHSNYDVSWCGSLSSISFGMGPSVLPVPGYLFLQLWEVSSHDFIRCIFYLLCLFFFWNLCNVVLVYLMLSQRPLKLSLFLKIAEVVLCYSY